MRVTKSFSGFDRIFELSDPLSNRPLRGEFSEAKALELTRAEMFVGRPVYVKWAMGGFKPSDLIWTTSAHPVLIHERVLLGYIYGPAEEVQQYAPIFRFVFVPVIGLSGFWMWKGDALRRLISKRSA